MSYAHLIIRKRRTLFWSIVVCWVYLASLIGLLWGVSGSKFLGPNFMFNADCIWWLRFAAGSTTETWTTRIARHPLLTPLVIAMGHCNSFVQETFVDGYASYIMMAIFVLLLHLTIAVLLSVVGQILHMLTVPPVQRLSLFLPIVGLSGVSFIMTLPESFGLAMALLLTCWVMGFSSVYRKVRLSPNGVLAAAIVCGGCTTTNVLAPLINEGARRWCDSSTAQLLWDRNHRLNKLLLVVVAVVAGASLVFFVASSQWLQVRELLKAVVPSTLWNVLRSGIRGPLRYANFRWFYDPIQALMYSLWGTVAPVIPPRPGFSEWGLTYEPTSIWQFSSLQWPGIVAWWAVIAYGLWGARQRHERFLVVSCLGWIGWNLLFHNLWGDEFFLYSPHWVWCLWLLFGMGLNKLKPRVAVIVATCIIFAQLVGWGLLLRAINIAAGGDAPINKLVSYFGRETFSNISSTYVEKIRQYQEEFQSGYGLPQTQFYLFGMGLREKYMFANNTLVSLADKSVFRQWDVQSLEFIPHEYRVIIYQNNGNVVEIAENEQAVWLIEDGSQTPLPRTERPLRLPKFEAHPYSLMLRVLHHEVLIGVTPQGPVPNVLVYKRPWYRDAAMMAMVLKATGNLDQIRDWILGLTEPYDLNNKVAEPDNLGQVLYLISLVSDKNHPLVARVLAEAEVRAVRKPGSKYLDGLTDGAHHPVYQTKWLKYGLTALGLPDDWTIPPLADSYSALFWMDYREHYIPTKDASNPRLYPYLDWACAHFHGQEPGPLNHGGYPLTWEAKAGQADYSSIALISPAWRIQRIAGPHGWHAAEAFLYLSSFSDTQR